MSTLSPPHRAIIRTIVIIALAAVVLALSLPDIRRLWQPLGSVGYGTDIDNVVTVVDRGSSADKAGLKVGDRIDVGATDPKYRWYYATTATNLPGQQFTFAVVRGRQKRDVTFVSVPGPMDAATKVLIVSRELAMLMFVGIGAALVLLRPSIATWAFYIFCLGLNGSPCVVVPLSLSPPWNYISSIVELGLFGTAGLVSVAVFATFFLHDHVEGWRAWVYRAAPFAWLVLAGLQIYVLMGGGWFGWPLRIASNLASLLQAIAVIVAMYALVATYVSVRGSDRQRIRWVVFGFGIALGANLVVNYLLVYFSPPYWLAAGLWLIPVVAPLTVAYAVIRHRVIDTSFVVSRALVYAVLTTSLVGILSIIDWFLIAKLKLVRLGTIAEVGVAVAVGFWFNGLHKRIDWVIDATFFRQRHLTEQQLAQNAVALPLATTTSAVAHFLVREPVKALLLASAALFRRDRDGAFVREESEGWQEGMLCKLDDRDEPLIMLAQTEKEALSLYRHPWRTEGIPSGPAQPVLALPIIVRRELSAIVFYGSHVHGEALDPDEIKAIAGLAIGAAAAYDHLEAQAMQRAMESMSRENESLRTELAEARIQPA